MGYIYSPNNQRRWMMTENISGHSAAGNMTVTKRNPRFYPYRVVWESHAPPCRSRRYPELFDTFFFTRDFWLGGVPVSAGDGRLCTVWEEYITIRNCFSPNGEFNVFMHMDYLNYKQSADRRSRVHTHMACSAFAILFAHVCVCVACSLFVWARGTVGHFTGRRRADAVFTESRPLAVQAAMSRTLALKRANFWWAVMLLAREVGVGLGERWARRLGNWHWTAG